MTQEYVPVACSWPWHPKVINLSLEARGLWISGLCYAGTNGGFIPAKVVDRFAPRRKLTRLVEELVAINLWVTADQGWFVHDFDEHCEWLSKRRERDRERQKRLRVSRYPSRDTNVTVTPEREQRTENMNMEHDRSNTVPLYEAGSLAARAAALAKKMAL